MLLDQTKRNFNKSCSVGKEQEFKQMLLPGPYSGAQCLDGYTVISYDDLKQFESQLITKHFFNVPTWINALAKYTPWMIYRGQQSTCRDYCKYLLCIIIDCYQRVRLRNQSNHALYCH